MSDLTYLQQRVADMMADKMHLAVPPVDADLFALGCLDSLSFVALLAHVEEEFDMRIDLKDLDLGRFQSIAGIAAFIAEWESAPVESSENRTEELVLRDLSWGYAG